MTRPLFIYVALFTSVAFGQSEGDPNFDADHVDYVDHPVPLAPGLILSIFGDHLGPSRGCESYHDAQGIYPKELCDAQVLVGGVPSELLWVQAGQINFRVPRETQAKGAADLTVIYQGRRSKAVAMPIGFESPTIALESPARVGMPVWLKVTMPYDRESGIHYPFQIYPAAFGCNEVEVRRNGVLLPRFADLSTQATETSIGPGNPCGWLGFQREPHFRDRLPLHLQYRFDQPGTYEVRLTMPHHFEDDVASVVDWTKIEILPADNVARARWLADQVANAPDDPADLLADFLPNILGNPDVETIKILQPYLQHPDRLVRDYAKHGLTYWPDAQRPSDAVDADFLHLR
jgi:hypothetical protein